MELNSEQIKLGAWRLFLRLLPLIIMGLFVLMTFWLVKKTSPPEGPALARVRLHEPDYTIIMGHCPLSMS